MAIDDFYANTFAFQFMDIPKIRAERLASTWLNVWAASGSDDGEDVWLHFRQQIHASIVPSAAANQKADVGMIEREDRGGELADGAVAAMIAVDKAMALIFRDMHLAWKRAAGRLVTKGRAFHMPIAVVVAFKFRDEKVFSMQGKDECEKEEGCGFHGEVVVRGGL